MHVDDFINNPFIDEFYAQWILHHFRLPATLQVRFVGFMKNNKLFCTYENKRYRVTGASRLGDVWLVKDFDREYGYNLRVEIDDCTSWSDKP